MSGEHRRRNDAPLRVGVLGAFGVGNLGNDASLDAMLQQIRSAAPDASFVCFCPEPDVIEAGFGIAAEAIRVKRPDWGMGSRLARLPHRVGDAWRAYQKMGQLDALVVPGTGILDDFGGEKPTGWPLTLAVWFAAARLRRARTALVSIGAGPLSHPASRRLARIVAALAQYRSFRDRGSCRFMADIGFDVSEHDLVPDIAFSLPVPDGRVYAVNRALPFLTDAASYVFSMLAVSLLRTPSHRTPKQDRRRLRTDLAEGWRFLWGQPFLRTTTFLYGLTNPIGPGVLLALVVVCEQQNLSPAIIGVLLAAFSGCLLLGSLLSGFVRRRLSTRAVMLLELSAWPVLLLFAVWPNAYVLAASLLPVTLVIPVTDSVVISYRMAATPDRLVGRVESVRSTMALALTPFGALLAGLLLSAMPARQAILIFASATIPLAIWGVLTPALKNLPGVADDEHTTHSTAVKHN